MSRARRCAATFVAVCMGLGGMAQTARAGGLITAEQVAVSQGLRTAADHRVQVLAALDRADVAAALAQRGVSVDDARARVAALTDAEAAQLATQIDDAPAGASELVGTLVLVLVVLLFTDIFGYTRIFPFIHSDR